MQLLPNGLIATGDGNGNLQFWNYTSSTYDVAVMTQVASTSGNTIFDIALINGQYLATAGTDNNIKIWDYSKYTSVSLYKTLTGHTNMVRSLKLLSSQYLISGSYDKSVRIWDLTTFSQYKKLTSTDYIFAVDSVSSDIPISGDNDYKLIYWNITSGSAQTTKTTSSAAYSLATF